MRSCRESSGRRRAGRFGDMVLPWCFSYFVVGATVRVYEARWHARGAAGYRRTAGVIVNKRRLEFCAVHQCAELLDLKWFQVRILVVDWFEYQWPGKGPTWGLPIRSPRDESTSRLLDSPSTSGAVQRHKCVGECQEEIVLCELSFCQPGRQRRDVTAMFRSCKCK